MRWVLQTLITFAKSIFFWFLLHLDYAQTELQNALNLSSIGAILQELSAFQNRVYFSTDIPAFLIYCKCIFFLFSSSSFPFFSSPYFLLISLLSLYILASWQEHEPYVEVLSHAQIFYVDSPSTCIFIFKSIAISSLIHILLLRRSFLSHHPLLSFSRTGLLSLAVVLKLVLCKTLITSFLIVNSFLLAVVASTIMYSRCWSPASSCSLSRSSRNSTSPMGSTCSASSFSSTEDFCFVNVFHRLGLLLLRLLSFLFLSDSPLIVPLQIRIFMLLWGKGADLGFYNKKGRQ